MLHEPEDVLTFTLDTSDTDAGAEKPVEVNPAAIASVTLKRSYGENPVVRLITYRLGIPTFLR